MRAYILALVFCILSVVSVGKAQDKPVDKTSVTDTDKKTKDVPTELTDKLKEVKIVNNTLNNIKAKYGIKVLEDELSGDIQTMYVMADKDGFQYDPKTDAFVEKPAPEVKDAPKPKDKK